MIFAGIDAGSRSIKVVLLDSEQTAPLVAACTDQGPRPGECTDQFYQQVLCEQGLTRADIACVVATGYARSALQAVDTTITEITCHARGVAHLLPRTRTVIEIGGQDSKLLRLWPNGSVRDFAMNDRCAAGTGRFLEMVADRLKCPLDQLGELARASAAPAVISSMCAIFAETEIIGLLACGQGPQDIVAGVQAAVASRMAAMAGRDIAAPVVFTGGVARVAGMDKALEKALGQSIALCPQPQFTGALGAALMAMRHKRHSS